MKFTIKRDTLLKPLQQTAGVVEKRLNLPILSNILLELDSQSLSLVGTDLEIELVSPVSPENIEETGSITVPARKLLDICRSLPDDAEIRFQLQDNNRLVVKSGASRFSLTTLPAKDFPAMQDASALLEFSLTQRQLRSAMEATHFSMAQQDVRYYLNGMLWEFAGNEFRCVATDGHRLALKKLTLDDALTEKSQAKQIIVPRKTIQELLRLLEENDEAVHLAIGQNHLAITAPKFTFTSKLIDGSFPNYEAAIPKNNDKVFRADRDGIKEILNRVAILSNEKLRGVAMELKTGNLQVSTHNPEQDRAEETMSIEYHYDDLRIGFNVNYLLDVLNTLPGGEVSFHLATPQASAQVGRGALLRHENDDSVLYVVSPMNI